MITDTASGTVVAATPSDIRSQRIIGTVLLVPPIAFFGIGIGLLAAGRMAGIAGLVIAAIFVPALRSLFLRYEVTVSDRSVRIRRPRAILVRPIDDEFERTDIHGYRLETYRGVRFALVAASGERLGPTVRYLTGSLSPKGVTAGELSEVMDRYGIPRVTGPRPALGNGHSAA
jgi:hypothetical protein